MRTEPWVQPAEDAPAGAGDRGRRPVAWTYPRAALAAATWGYALGALGLLGLVRVVGESAWPVTLLLFCPRWVYLAPAVPLALASVAARRPSQWSTLGAALLVIAGPVMGFTARPGRTADPPSSAVRVRILTFNQYTHHFRAADLIRLIERDRVDVVCLQETLFDPVLEAYFAKGWARDRGRCIANRLPIVREFEPSIPRYDDPTLDRVLVRARTGEEFVVASVHRPSMSAGFRAFLAGDVAGLRLALDERREAMPGLVASLAEVRAYPTIVAGDFNTPADSSLLDPLRADFQVGFEEAGLGYGYTWPARWPGIRIDHVLATRDCTFTRCRVGPDLGSDHRPVLAEVALPPARSTRPGAAARR